MISNSRQKKRKSFELLQQGKELSSMPNHLKSLLLGMRLLGKLDLDFYKFTPKQVQEFGEKFIEGYLSTLSIEQRLAGMSTEEIEACLEQRKKQS